MASKRAAGGEKCPAIKADGSRCQMAAGFGTDHVGFGCCRFHQGTDAARQRNSQRQTANAAVKVYGLPVEIDPFTALMQELYRTAGHVQWLQDKIQEFEDAKDALTQRVGSVESGFSDVESVWLSIYHKERAHFVQVSKTCIAAGIAERQIRLAEDQARMIAAVLKGALKELGVKTDDPAVDKVVRRQLTAVAGQVAA